MPITAQAELEAALLDGGDVDCTGTVLELTSAMQVTRPARIRGGRFTRSTGSAFEITSADVELDGVELEGGPGDYDPAQRLVHAHGTLAAPLAGVRVRNCVMRGSRGDNVWLERCVDSAVESNDIADYLYSGVMVISGQGVSVSRNQIRDAPLTPGVANVYGIAISDLDNTLAARSRDCSIVGNHVDRVDWEGIDTHGADRLTITGNHVTGCPRGIALVTGNSSRIVAPTNCVVSGNTVSGEGARMPLLAGVYLAGIAGTPASATVVGNQLLGYDDVNPIFTSYWDRDDTYIGQNSRPFVPWTPIILGADFNSSTTYPPEFMVDGNGTWVRGGVIPKSGGLAVRDAIGSIPHAAAWPTSLTFLGLAKGSNAGAGNGQVAVSTTGVLTMFYGTGSDSYTYFLHGCYQAA